MTDDFLEAMRNSAGGSGEWSAPPAFGVKELNAALSRAETAEAEVARLRAALKPFADYADPYNRIFGFHVVAKGGSADKPRTITMGDCYHARALLAAQLSPSVPATSG